MEYGRGLLPSCLFFVLLGWSMGICPPKCTCRDDGLTSSCADASLGIVPIQLNPNTQKINLSGNKISTVHYTLEFYTQLRHLDVSRNKISSLGGKNFEFQKSLTHLNASHNQIGGLGKDTFTGLKAVKKIDLSNNQIETIDDGAFKDAVQLEYLDLSYNLITYFADEAIFKRMRSLRVLHLHNNQIVDVPTGLLKNLPTPCSLETLTLGSNLIENIDDKSFPTPCSNSIKTLTLGSNVVRDIEKSAFNPLHNLQSLDLSYNNLSSVPTQQLSKLTRLSELDLSGNTLAEVKPVAFQSLFQMKILKLCRMPRMTRIDARALVDNIQLESVIIEENPGLQRIPARLFHGNPHLMSISLRSNALTTMDVSHFPLDRLRLLDVTENPLNCNCSLLWLWKLARESDATDIDLSNETWSEENKQPLRIRLHRLKCASPEKVRGFNLVDLTESNVRCETTWITVAVVTALVLALFGATCVALLLFGGTSKFCRTKQDSDSGSIDARRLPQGYTPTPTPILMLMPDKYGGGPDPVMQGYVKSNGDLWLKGQNEYTPDFTSARKPHIVYV